MATSDTSALTQPAFIFGPIPSRRLGRSLGVDLIPKKTCTLDCVYCELGITDRRALRRMEYVPTDAVIEELRAALPKYPDIDVVTFSGSGEPTLHSELGRILKTTKELTRVPVAVITNGTLLFMEDVRKDLMQADIVLPSLDAATKGIFGLINRPHPHLDLEKIIEGMVRFREEYPKQLWLEILLVRGLNDTPEELAHLKEAVKKIRPDRIQLNTVVRPPAFSSAQPVSHDALEAIRAYFGAPCEIIGITASHQQGLTTHTDSNVLLATLRRRAMTLYELSLAVDAPLSDLLKSLQVLKDLKLIREFEFQKKRYYEAMEITHR